PQGGGIGADDGEVVSEDFHVVPALRRHDHAQHVQGVAGVGEVEDVHGAAEDHRPLGGVGNGPEGVAAGGQGLSFDEHVATERDGGGRVGAGVPDPIPGDQAAEQPAAAGDGAVVLDAD